MNKEIKQDPVAASDYHSLFSTPKVITTKKYRFFIGAFANDKNSLHTTYNELLNAGSEDSLELRIQSPGGLVTECQMAINLMWNVFPGRSTAYIDSHASSAGAFSFCAADKRVIYENSRIMLHNYSGGYNGKHQDMKDRMEFDTSHIISFLKSTLKVGKNGYLSKKEFKKMVNGKEYWWDAKEMCKRGVATHIIIKGVEYTAEEYLKKNKGKK